MKIEVDKERTGLGDASLITLTNAAGASVTLSSLGAGIVAVTVPDRYGIQADVVAGYVPVDKAAVWDFEIDADDEVRFGIEPGHKRQISYRWTEDNVLEIYFQGRLSDHVLAQTYFDIDGSQEALVDEYLWVNSAERPDFSTATRLRERLVVNDVFAHRWQLRDWQRDVMNDAALFASHRSGRQLSIHTSYPTLRIEIPSSRTGIAFSTLPSPHNSPLRPPQTTFLHFSLIH